MKPLDLHFRRGELVRRALTRLATAIRRTRILPGRGSRITETALGQILSATAGAAWRHPWYTDVIYEPETSMSPACWVATVKPGFVNGRAPVVATIVKDAPAQTLARLAARDVSLDNLDMPVDSPLYDAPTIPLSFRPIGRDGSASESVPRFFKERGVGDPRRPLTETLLGPRNIADEMPLRGNRLLRACEIVLVQPRAALTADTELGSPTVDGWSIRQTLGIRSPAPGAKLRLRAQRNNDQRPGVSAFDPASFESLWEEPTEDTLPISTVYLLSPPDEPEGSQPGPGWEVHVQHHRFWNLRYAQTRFVAAPLPEPLQLFVPLAGGVAQPTISGLLSIANDAFAQMTNILAARSLQGRFWTV